MLVPEDTLHGVTCDLTTGRIHEVKGVDGIELQDLRPWDGETVVINPVDGKYRLDGGKTFLVDAVERMNLSANAVIAALSREGIDDIRGYTYQRSENARNFVEATPSEGAYGYGDAGGFRTFIRTHIPLEVPHDWRHAAVFFASGELPHAGNVKRRSYTRLFFNERETRHALEEATIMAGEIRLCVQKKVGTISTVPFSLRPEVYVWIGPADRHATGKCKEDPTYRQVSLLDRTSIDQMREILTGNRINKICMVAYSNIEIRDMGHHVAYMLDQSTIPRVNTHITAPWIKPGTKNGPQATESIMTLQQFAAFVEMYQENPRMTFGYIAFVRRTPGELLRTTLDGSHYTTREGNGK